MAMNLVVQQGNLTDDVEVKTVGSGVQIGRFSLAVQRSFKNKNGERETDFHRCVIFGKRANVLAKFVGKGSQIIIRGELQNDNYTDKNGTKHYGYQVNVADFSFVGGKPSGNQETSNHPQNNQPKHDPFASASTNQQVSDDDLPF